MATLGDKVRDTLQNAFDRAAHTLFDAMESVMQPHIAPSIQTLLDNPEIPSEIKALAKESTGKKSFAWFPVLGAIAFMTLYPALQAAFSGRLRRATYYGNRLFRPARFDPLSLSEARLRGFLDKAKFDDVLSDLGWSVEDIETYEKLLEQLPNPQDLIRMELREVFRPEFRPGLLTPPPSKDFYKWMDKLGFKPEWADSYWAAHWVLPSVGQGYEMFHRIKEFTEADLRTLLRRQDVLQEYHDNLIKIAYRPFTRVDVRRMFTLRILDRGGVKQAYLDIGYDEERAEKMTEFTVKFEAGKERDLTKSDILSAYRKKSIDLDTAREYLQEIDYSDDDIDFLFAKEDAGQEVAERDLSVSHYQSLYLTGILEKPAVTAALAELGFSKEEIALLFRLWDLEKMVKVRQPTKAELVHWLYEAIINMETFRKEMADIGYPVKHIDRYVKEYLADQLAEAQKEEDRARKEKERVEKAEFKTTYETNRAKIDVDIAQTRVFIASALKQLLELGTNVEQRRLEELALRERQALARLTLEQSQEIANLRLELRIALRGISKEEKAELERAALEEIQAIEVMTSEERAKVSDIALEERAEVRKEILESLRKLRLDILAARKKIEGFNLQKAHLKLEFLE